ncbi:putative FecR protein [Novosphingobium subterraneum]|uniref:Putative FecR protein n=2 Tax=Novosphingobium subterraneum TaxID=48936 RepID=A0A0B8ZQ47_9SPHN|nr:putative FecR protein [Novosphingobium subterraneum]
MSGEGGADSEGNAVATDEAAHWFVILRGPDPDRHRPDFVKWRDASELNRVAFEQVAATFDGAEVLKRSAAPRHRRPPLLRLDTRSWIGGALATSVAVALATGVVRGPLLKLQQTASDGRATTFATRHGTMRTVQLEQGASLALDSATEVHFEEQDGEPVVTVVKGRAQLRLPGGGTEWVVRVDDSEIISRNGIFDVSWSGGKAPYVQLYAGEAMTRPVLQSAGYVVGGRGLPTGLSMRLARGRAEPLQPRFAADERDWPQGWVQYRSVPLADLLHTVNRYAAKPIILSDPALGRLRISGRFRIVDPSAVALNLGRVFALTVTERPEGFYIDRP